jgi:hypothetical protein
MTCWLMRSRKMEIKSKFEMAIDFVLPAEGGYVNDPADPGGETNFGISKRKYPDINIKDLTVAGAITIYRRDYWDRNSLDKYNLPLSIVAFDSYVQHRPTVAQGMLDFAGDSWQRLITARRDFYGNLIAKDPSLVKFLRGWTIRLNNLSKYVAHIEQQIENT